MKKLSLQILLLFAVSISVFAQSPGYKSQEISEADGVPVLLKHLPDWESVKGQAKITNSIDEVRTEFGNPAVLSG
ncbi:MAG TPA: hypothetical protein PLK77_15535, partial [Pyrinomonadaceae bacterium]|nr:hypothetical protein [Pyrinomonadaceae bacterium]